jgi:4-nitrophenyl phosphatase
MAADPKDLSRKITDVIIGFHRDFDYARLALYSSLVRSGARLIGTNEDATYPTPEGVIPGGGSILAAVATASGSAPIVAGKPHQTMATLLQDRLGATRAHHTWMVGDRMSTDGLFAQRLGCRFAHIRSDVTEVGGSVTPSHTFYSLADFADALLGGAFE